MQRYMVRNRDGELEPLNIKKIQEKTEAAVEGLKGVSQSELELDAKIQFKEGMSTDEIQQILINTAVDKIDIDVPNWTFVAARLFLTDKYHKVGKKLKNKKGQRYPHLRTYLEYGENIGRIFAGLKDMYNLDDLNDYIDETRDLQFTYLGIKTLYDRYIIKDKDGEPVELPQHLFMGVAMFLASKEKDKQFWAKKFYDVLSKFEVMAATPTLSNARTTRHQLSSCYLGSMNDNIESIFDDFKEMALLSKFGGGIGWDFSKIRALGGYIDNNKNAAGGVVPWLRITNDIAIAVDQLGVRKGAIAVYCTPWHLDVEDFIDLKKNSGEERRRAHDLFPALFISDLFMKRVVNDEMWTLFDPMDVPELNELYGEKFEAKYLEYESDSTIVNKRVISAKELWKKILLQYYETGNPFLVFKDLANYRNQNNHTGMIRSSNLCLEIFQNTEPNHYIVEVLFEDGTKEYFEENDIVKVDPDILKPAKKITNIDLINGKQVDFVQKVIGKQGKTAVCNLASINLSKINTPEKINKIVPIAIRMLDNVIDLNYYPTKKTKDTNKQNRAIGLGVMGEAQLLAEKEIYWGTEEHLHLIDKIMEYISYNAINSSIDLAEEKGKYPEFTGSKWEQGILPIDTANINAKNLINRAPELDWDLLRNKAKKGIRNGYLMAIAPTSSISILCGTTQAIEPVYKRKWYEENMSGLIPVVVPNLSPDTYQYYQTAYELDQTLLVKAAAIRQKWIDQGQSVNIFIPIEKASGKYLNKIYTLGWQLGVKSFYYLRSESPKEQEKEIMDRSMECVGCQ